MLYTVHIPRMRFLILGLVTVSESTSIASSSTFFTAFVATFFCCSVRHDATITIGTVCAIPERLCVPWECWELAHFDLLRAFSLASPSLWEMPVSSTRTAPTKKTKSWSKMRRKSCCRCRIRDRSCKYNRRLDCERAKIVKPAPSVARLNGCNAAISYLLVITASE